MSADSQAILATAIGTILTAFATVVIVVITFFTNRTQIHNQQTEISNQKTEIENQKTELDILRNDLEHNKQHLIVSNYDLIMRQIDSITAKKCRGILYNNYPRLVQLQNNYLDKKGNLANLNEVAKYTAGIYENVGFLLKQNDELKTMILEHHGFTMGRLWMILKDLHEVWKKSDGVLNYENFKKLGVEAFEDIRFHDRIKYFIENNHMRSDSKSIIHSPLDKNF